MAQTPEGKIKDKIINWIRLTWPTAYIIRYPAGMFGRTGVSDLICCVDGIFIAIEVKTEKNNPTKLQLIELKKVQNANGIAVLIRGFDKNKLEKMKVIIDDKIQRIHLAS